MGMTVLYLEETYSARKSIIDFSERHYQEDRHKFVFVETVTALDEYIYEMEGYNTYGAIAVDLAVEMSLLPREDIVSRIPLLDRDDVPTKCIDDSAPGNPSIPLYGLDYFRLVIAKRKETQQMVSEGRVVLFSGHAAKIRSRGLYNETLAEFANTQLIDRAERDATGKLFSMLSTIEESLKLRGVAR